MTKEGIHFDLTKNDDWFDIKLLTDCKIKQCIQDDTYQNAMKLVFKKLNIFSTHFVQIGRGIGPVEIEFKQIKHQYINNIGKWKQYTQDE